MFVELSSNPIWWVDNRFRNGYLIQLAIMLKEKIPMIPLKVVYNIKSQVKLFRSKTTTIADILQIRDFVQNYERCTNKCDKKSAHNQYIKV